MEISWGKLFLVDLKCRFAQNGRPVYRNLDSVAPLIGSAVQCSDVSGALKKFNLLAVAEGLAD